MHIDISRNRDGLDQAMGYERGESAGRNQRVTDPKAVEQTHAPPVLKEGSEGPRVSDVQAQLAALGYSGKDGKPITADGEFGPNTKHAVEAFHMNQCAAFVIGSDVAVARYGVDEEAAKESALNYCRNNDVNCRVYYSACSLPLRPQ